MKQRLNAKRGQRASTYESEAPTAWTDIGSPALC